MLARQKRSYILTNDLIVENAFSCSSSVPVVFCQTLIRNDVRSLLPNGYGLFAMRLDLNSSGATVSDI